MTTQIEKSQNEAVDNEDRRVAIKKIAAGVGVLAGCSVLPEKWTKPVIGSIALPAHAATSGPVATDAAPATSSSKGGYNASETYSLRSLAGNNKRYTWLNQTGAAYGGEVKFEFSGGCGELVVPNAAVSHGADGSTKNHNQAFYFCGTDFAPGTREYNGGKASVFAPPNCNATSVTLHYNK